MEQVLNEQTSISDSCDKEGGTAPESNEKVSEVSFKKFKNVEALEKAYSSLECEFTKRSQRLKELLRENDEYKKQLEITKSPRTQNSSQGQDNLIKLIESHPQIASSGDILSIDEQTEGGKYDLVNGYISMLEEKVGQLEKFLSDEKLLSSHIEGTAIKDKIIKEYLKSVLNNFGGARLLDGGGVISIAPPNKPKTIAEAGLMAKEYLK